MKFEKFRDRVQGGLIPSALLLPLLFFGTGCVYYPDFVHPAPHAALMNPLKEGIINKIPYSVTRTPQANKDGSLMVEFEWKENGRLIWFEKFGFGTAAAKWRFVLFGPDGTVVCGNEWQNTEVATRKCPITEEQVGKPFSADLDFRFPGDPEEEFSSVGRVFYFVLPASSPLLK
jgi:hypothetical protein